MIISDSELGFINKWIRGSATELFLGRVFQKTVKNFLSKKILERLEFSKILKNSKSVAKMSTTEIRRFKQYFEYAYMEKMMDSEFEKFDIDERIQRIAHEYFKGKS